MSHHACFLPGMVWKNDGTGSVISKDYSGYLVKVCRFGPGLLTNWRGWWVVGHYFLLHFHLLLFISICS